MNSDFKPAKNSSLRKRIALVAAVVVIGVIVVYLLRLRTDILRTDASKSVPASPRDKEVTALIYSRPDFAAYAQAAQSKKVPTIESAWEAILTNLKTLLKGDKVEVCGLSDFDAALFIAGDSEVGISAVNTTLAQVKDKLVESNQPREQALGFYMQAHLAEWAQRNAEQSKHRICGDDFECVFNMAAASKPIQIPPEVRAAAAAPLVKLALAERDPAIIAAAIYVCGGNYNNTCSSITIADWVAADQDNAAVWLMLADAAHFRKDVAGREDALRRAAAATGYDLHVPPLSVAADSALVKAQSPLAQFHISHQLAVSHITTLLPPTYALTNHCIHDKNPDDTRKTLCDTLTNKLLQNDESLVGLSTAIHLGKKIGWDEARLKTMQDEKAVGLGRLYDASSGANMFSCQELAKNEQFSRKMLSKSERAIGRELAASSGKTMAELAEQYRVKYPDLRK